MHLGPDNRLLLSSLDDSSDMCGAHWITFFFRQVDGTAPTFVTKPTIRQDADGTTLVFHCSIYADPKPVVTWFHDGDKVQDNKKFQVFHIFSKKMRGGGISANKLVHKS